MKLRVFILVALIVSVFALKCKAQMNTASHKISVQLPEVALLGLVSESNYELNLGVSGPTEAGDAVDIFAKEEDRIWINYSSIITKSARKRKVIAVVQGQIPEGIKLKVQASDCTGSGKGKLGETTGLVTLSNQPADVIVGIGSCFTGKGANNGHYLTYKLEDNTSGSDYSELTADQTSLNVVYTLTDYN